MVENSEIFSTSLKSNILQDPTVTCVQKCFFYQKFATYPKNGSFGGIKSQELLENCLQTLIMCNYFVVTTFLDNCSVLLLVR